MMIVERVLVISDENRASPSWKGSIRKVQTEIYLRNYSNVILINFQELKYHAYLYLLIHNLNGKLFGLLKIYKELFCLQKKTLPK